MTKRAAFGDWANAALGFFYPGVCQLCGAERAAPGDGFVGERCRRRARFITAPFCSKCGIPFRGDVTSAAECANCAGMDLQFRSARSAVVAGGPVLEAIHRYKYRRALWFEPFLAGLLIRQAEPELRRERWDWVVPVPLYPVRRREREYNQAERLAARLGKACGIPVRGGLLRRLRPTRTQTLLTREERVANVRDAFGLGARERLGGKRIVLVDDVLTTAATTSACAGVLRRAGADTVCVWTVARGL
jgi:ComF family protein